MTVSFCTARRGPAPITVTQQSVDALREVLAAHAARHGIDMIAFDRSDRAHLVYDFDARAYPFAIATIAACFDNDADVIAVVEEAQFQNRCLRIWKDRASGEIRLDLSLYPDSNPAPEEAKLVREIEMLEARMRQTERIHARSEDYIAQIDWSAMTRDDHETAASHREVLGWTLYELDHGIEEASRELWAYCA